jgi:hypothetical protein
MEEHLPVQGPVGTLTEDNIRYSIHTVPQWVADIDWHHTFE